MWYQISMVCHLNFEKKLEKTLEKKVAKSWVDDIQLSSMAKVPSARNHYTTGTTTRNIAILKHLSEANPNNLFKANRIKGLGY